MGDNSQTLVLVTGATGYIASHITQQLLEKGYLVRGTTRDLNNDSKVQPLKELQPQQNLELVEAELLDENSWIPAVDGCKFVIHVACPIALQLPVHEDEVVKPAVEGTLSILKACVAAKTVKRVVLTSSNAAISQDFELGGKFVEQHWTDPTKPDLDPYIKSKTLQEKAAWDFVENLPAGKLELAVINPVMVLGPVLVNRLSASMELPRRLLEGQVLLIPNLNYAVIDVRDVAAAHISAMLVPEAAGHRHICSNVNMSLKEIAEMLASEFEPLGYRVSTVSAPNFLIKFYGLFDKLICRILPTLGKISVYENKRMIKVLGITPLPESETFLEMGHSLVARGQVKRKAMYVEPKVMSASESNPDE